MVSLFDLLTAPADMNTTNHLLWGIYVVLAIMIVIKLVQMLLAALVAWGITPKVVEWANKTFNAGTSDTMCGGGMSSDPVMNPAGYPTREVTSDHGKSGVGASFQKYSFMSKQPGSILTTVIDPMVSRPFGSISQDQLL